MDKREEEGRRRMERGVGEDVRAVRFFASFVRGSRMKS